MILVYYRSLLMKEKYLIFEMYNVDFKIPVNL